MQSVLPFDLTEIIEHELTAGDRAPDGLLHPSTHLSGPLRHAQLDLAGAPKKPRPIIDRIVLHTGTMWHREIGSWLVKNGVPTMVEVNLTPWLPAGWSGTADLVVWNPDLQAFVLVDMKTTKGTSMKYRLWDGASEEHIWQTSSYWHALKKMGIPLAKVIAVFYLPKDDTRKKDELIEPVLIDFEPVPVRKLKAEMDRRKGRVDEYLDSIGGPRTEAQWKRPKALLNDVLDPPQERVQKIYRDRASGDAVLKLVPHWTAAYCPFPANLCACSEQKTETIGRYDANGEYHPSKGKEEIEPLVTP